MWWWWHCNGHLVDSHALLLCAQSGSVVLTWSDLSQAQTDALLASKTVEEQHKYDNWL